MPLLTNENSFFELRANLLERATFHHQRAWPLIEKLYSETEQAQRHSLYRELNVADPDFVASLDKLLCRRVEEARQLGFASYFDKVRDQDSDILPWDAVIQQQVPVLSNFSKSYAQFRREALAVDKFYAADYWFVAPAEQKWDAHFLKMDLGFKRNVALLKRFFKFLGYAAVMDHLDFEADSQATCARLAFDADGHFIKKILVCESQIRAQRGTLAHWSALAHEVGHVIQSLENKCLATDNIIPKAPYTEVISMFFEKLILNYSVLRVIFSLDRKTVRKALFRREFEEVESVARFLMLFEFSCCLYALAGSRDFTAEKIGIEWAQLKNRYFGFDDKKSPDHTWLVFSSYIVAYPLYERSYVVGSVISDGIMRTLERRHAGRFFSPEPLADLKHLVSRCSDKGKFNTAEDNFRAAGFENFSPSIFPAIIAGKFSAMTQRLEKLDVQLLMAP